MNNYAPLLWAVWLCLPQYLRLKAYRLLEKYSSSDLNGCAVELPFGLYAKRGPRATVNEALATHHVSLYTTIPVPTVLDVLPTGSNGTYFLMTRLSGQEVAEMPRTLSDCTDQELDVFVATVGGWLQQLRALGPSPHGDAVCGFIGGPFYSYRIKHDEPIGPFASQDEFHAQWYNTLPEQANPGLRAVAARLRSDRRYRMYFTHGDISPNNILVDDDYKPVGLIDFGCAGWMPEYWELTYAVYRRQRYRGWVKAFTQIFPQYEDELAVEMEQWKYISPW
ncbi:kinase-like domain-containing protein [Schizophyllum commune]